MAAPVIHEASIVGMGDAPLAPSETELLLDDLYALACNNPLFRRGRKDFVDFEVGEGDVIEDSDMTFDRMNFSHRFKAERHRDSDTGPYILYEFGIVGRLAECEMSPQLASRILDIPPDEAVVVMGRVTLEQGLKFTIGSDNKDLNVCHNITYFNEEDEEVFTACSCPSDHEGLYYSGVEETPSGDIAVLPVPAQQVGRLFIERRVEHEPVQVKTIAWSFDIADWSEFEKTAGGIYDIFEKAEEDAEYGREVLRKVRRALLIQAGIKINKRTLPPLKH